MKDLIMLRVNIKGKYLLIFFTSSIIYTACQIFFFNTILNSSIVSKDELWADILLQFAIIYPLVLAMCAVDFRLINLLNRYIPLSRSVAFHSLFVFAGNIIVCLALHIIFGLFHGYVLHTPMNDALPLQGNLILTITANIPIILVIELIFYFQSEQQAITASEKAKRDALSFQYNALRAQVNPHFLFNSLNVLSSLIYENQDDANKYTKALSQIYRQALSVNEKPLSTLDEELRFFRSYVFLLEIRFENAFKIHIDEVGKYGDKKIVSSCLQLLMENAFKHNVSSGDAPLFITLNINQKGITFTNKISLRYDVDKGGIGLKYLAAQCDLYDQQIEVENDEQRFTVKVPFIV